MTKVKVTNVKVYKPSVEKAIREKGGKLVEVEKKSQNLEMNYYPSDFMDKAELEAYRAKFKTEPNFTVLLTYEEHG